MASALVLPEVTPSVVLQEDVVGNKLAGTHCRVGAAAAAETSKASTPRASRRMPIFTLAAALELLGSPPSRIQTRK